MDATSSQSTVLDLDRKIKQVNKDLVLHLNSRPILVNGTLIADTKKRYRCTHDGCGKAYTKPSRLEEHERSHTGLRPFVCETCRKSYLRETHLHAHARSHLPNEMRPFVCKQDGCAKRFWTLQHLQVHHSWHEGAKPYKCHERQCDEEFAKHHQLRAHICSVHALPGTKPYRCEHEGCSKSFDTNQHLSAHIKTHDRNRYTCVHPSCRLEQQGESGSGSLRYFPTWSSLQSHIKINHPPTCPYQPCNGKAFSNSGNLRAHLKLHENRAMDSILQEAATDQGDSPSPRKRRRRGGEFGRDWTCDRDNCRKDFSSEKALRVHINVCHLGQRNFVCTSAEGCNQTFGYKHLLQRHVAKYHASTPESSAPTMLTLALDRFEEEIQPHEHRKGQADELFDIDMITGSSYVEMAKRSKKVRCPYPDLANLALSIAPTAATTDTPDCSGDPVSSCDFVFSRAYDLRRHLTAFHGVVNIQKEVVDEWMTVQKQKLDKTT